MSQFDYIKEIAKYGLENDQQKLLFSLNELIEYSKKTRKVNFAIQLQSILKDVTKQRHRNGLTKIGSPIHYQPMVDGEVSDLILEKLTSEYSFDNLVCSEQVREQLHFFIKEHKSRKLLQKYDLPVSNKLLLHGTSGCGKTLASYVLAGELKKPMIVVNLGAIVSSKLGQTSKNLAKIFRKASTEDCILFFDEFDSLGKLRDYNQDHAEMKRVVNSLLQLFDYLPQTSIVIAATNQKNMVDNALLRRFDTSIEFPLPDIENIKDLVRLVLKNGHFQFDSLNVLQEFVDSVQGLSYFSIKKILITAIKRSLFERQNDIWENKIIVQTDIWRELLLKEKQEFSKD
ncbi:MAG: ATP-binding protein [Flavobacteriaceae bacterium]|nr:ATP-binding protein [Flavobacteriaceae bacterium]